ncbi:hypothetical protein Bca52824_066772 [Brassica carinata]|uniref:Uncharacterized protein n=1 Tax=Brassica carinata TaxID=52824 RepID=A0A8X7QMG6_BRACI|nr:hypothetical protein Bca52824_066772 [Brassica carinata]
MAKSLHIAMFVSIVMLFTSNSISSQEIDQYSQEAPGDVKISPTSDFDFYVNILMNLHLKKPIHLHWKLR